MAAISAPVANRRYEPDFVVTNLTRLARCCVNQPNFPQTALAAQTNNPAAIRRPTWEGEFKAIWRRYLPRVFLRKIVQKNSVPSRDVTISSIAKDDLPAMWRPLGIESQISDMNKIFPTGIGDNYALPAIHKSNFFPIR
jgi:hypothetical protein